MIKYPIFIEIFIRKFYNLTITNFMRLGYKQIAFISTLIISLFITTFSFGQTITSPTSSSAHTNPIPITLTIPEAYSSAQIIFTSTSGNYSNTISLKAGIVSNTSYSFSLSSNNLLSSSDITSASHASLPDDTYNIVLVYRNSTNTTTNTSATTSSVTIQTATPAPTLTNPSSSTLFNANTAPVFSYILPSAPLSGSTILNIGSANTYPLTNTIGSNTYTITSDFPPDGTYTSTISYSDYLGNPISSSAPITIIFDRNTLSPSISAPLTNSISTGTVTFTYSTPEVSYANSKKITLSQSGVLLTTIALSSTNSGTTNLNLNLKALSLSNPAINTITGTYTTSIPDGTYSVTFSYQDAQGNPASSSTINLTIDSHTEIASLNLPASGSTYSTQIPIFAILGEAYAPGTVNVTFEYVDGTYSNTITLNGNSLSRNFTFDHNNILLSTNVLNSDHTTLPDGLYNVTLAYQDLNANPVYTTTNHNVKIQTTTPSPTITLPINGAVYNVASTPTFTYTLPSAPYSGTAQLTLTNGTTAYVYTLPNQSGNYTYTITTNPPPDGTYSWTVRYQDYLGNPTASSTTNTIKFDRVTLSPSILSPLTNSTNTGTATFTYTVPEDAFPGSKQIQIAQNGTTITTIAIVDNNAGSLNLNFNDISLSNNQIAAVTGTTNIPDGTYTLTFSYQDGARNVASSNSINFTIDESTIRIPISFPLPNTLVTNNLNLKFTLPEPMLSGSLKLHLTSSTDNIFFTLADLTPNTYDWNINPSANILSVYASKFTAVSPSTITKIPAGNYTLTMIYQDAFGNRTDSGMFMTNIRFTPTILKPKINSPVANTLVSNTIIYMDSLPIANATGTKILYIIKNNTIISTINLTDKLKDTIYFDTHHLTNSLPVGATLSGVDSLSDGNYVLKLSYQDQFGNPASSYNDTINIDTSPFIGVLSHTSNTVYGTFTETLTFNKPVDYIGSNSIISNFINNKQSARIGAPIANNDKTIYSISITPLEHGIIKILYPQLGLARDLAGNPSQPIVADSVRYIDTTLITSPIIITPLNNTKVSTNIIYMDSIPRANTLGTKKLSFFNNGTIVSTVTLNNKLKDTIYFDTHHLTASLPVGASLRGVDSLSDNTYAIQLSYTDLNGENYKSNYDTLTIDTSPFIGVLSHTNNTVYGTFTETLTFNKPVDYIGSNSIISNFINNKQSARIGAPIANNDKTIYSISITPLENGIIKILYPQLGLARDLAGNLSQAIEVDSVRYIDSNILVTPLINGNVSFCTGDSVTLTSSIANTYLWSTGATTRSIIVKTGGTYNVKTTYDDHVKGISSNLMITANPIPNAPTLSRDGDNNLVSSAKYGNIWYLNGINTNDTSATLKPTIAGPYSVRTIQQGCASLIGATYYYLITDIQNISTDEFIKLSPNPFNTQVNADFHILGYTTLNLEIFDINTGNKLAAKENVFPGTTIQIPSIASGVYLFKLSSIDGKIRKQFKMVKL